MSDVAFHRAARDAILAAFDTYARRCAEETLEPDDHGNYSAALLLTWIEELQIVANVMHTSLRVVLERGGVEPLDAPPV